MYDMNVFVDTVVSAHVNHGAHKANKSWGGWVTLQFGCVGSITYHVNKKDLSAFADMLCRTAELLYEMDPEAREAYPAEEAIVNTPVAIQEGHDNV